MSIGTQAVFVHSDTQFPIHIGDQKFTINAAKELRESLGRAIDDHKAQVRRDKAAQYAWGNGPKIVKDENGNDVELQKGDRIIRYNHGRRYEPFHAIVTDILDDKIAVNGSGHIGGAHYRGWWGNLLSSEHIVKCNANSNGEVMK